MSLARDERHALVRTMTQTGPDAPTLCGDWTTRDLAAHLVVRERRIDTMPGIVLPPLAGHTERVRAGAADRPWEQLLADIESGPPVWSPLYLVDGIANAAEMFVHHEDVRRAAPGWQPRPLDAPTQDRLWQMARQIGRRGYRGTDVTVVFERPDGTRATVRRRGPRTVILRGEPSELLLHAFGRDEVRVETTGPAADVAEVAASGRGI
ncbi:hypothetical protein D092_09630 [Rhodococcus ruber Chol-4]|uniref:TIGR03085 family protein n=1 Tax=Rhodococcus ruber TaxID=1830 RepID=A0A098BJ71_9NOCA|nr:MULTISPECIES: TIGR03085 family metal-binding protein [Rhodococcus]MDO2377703.1 TIGR03085 family metal-binding protein [Rhodococcus ruber]MDX5310472.1 TIGR03085 family metal-binding protein [Rhodococcus sp. (in: high G+C Gram-positive bacteria)]AXY51944.1 hypothetical protein YT1_2524 [Rhodococcus ruber]KXF86393.1 hypothetical protein D092_09630 [Rhodococcus ruber Chol-4]MBP2211327.1 uncharacterized protein (TIGR03085 family) [Rhodococcus ruber]